MKILVTGAAGLIGKSICETLKPENEIIEADILDGYVKLDVTDESNVENYFNNNNVDVVVHSAYPHTENWGNEFFDVTNELFCKNIELQLGGAFNIIKHACRQFLRTGGGNIVIMGSVSGIMNPRFDTYEGLPMTTPVAYSCIKSGLISLCKYATKYLAGENIRINVVNLSGIFDNQDSTFVKRYKKYCLNKGMLDTEDLTGLIRFLVSDDSKYINGQGIVIDDGFTLY